MRIKNAATTSVNDKYSKILCSRNSRPLEGIDKFVEIRINS
jgi:hypothetical protein